jgi:CRISPR-associated DxTHG motif protein
MILSGTHGINYLESLMIESIVIFGLLYFSLSENRTHFIAKVKSFLISVVNKLISKNSESFMK